MAGELEAYWGKEVGRRQGMVVHSQGMVVHRVVVVHSPGMVVHRVVHSQGLVVHRVVCTAVSADKQEQAQYRASLRLM